MGAGRYLRGVETPRTPRLLLWPARSQPRTVHDRTGFATGAGTIRTGLGLFRISVRRGGWERIFQRSHRLLVRGCASSRAQEWRFAVGLKHARSAFYFRKAPRPNRTCTVLTPGLGELSPALEI